MVWIMTRQWHDKISFQLNRKEKILSIEKYRVRVGEGGA
jgi:hypothetical protein